MPDINPVYQEFLESKVPPSADSGFDISPEEVHPLLKPHQRDSVCWGVKKGRAAFFEAFGLGKTLIQLEVARLILKKSMEARKQGDFWPFCRFLIVAPLGVRQEFKRDAAMIGLEITFVRRIEECGDEGLYLTNYETIRDGKLDPRQFTGVSLDEAAVLRGFGGVATFRKFMQLFEGTSIYRFVATATPSPNEYIELLAYAAFLDVMDVSAGKTRFFKRDSTKADTLTLHPHKVREFYVWLSTWALFLQKPSDLRHSDEGYDLPEMSARWHELPSDYRQSGYESNGQGRLVNNSAIGVTHAAREKRNSLAARIAQMEQLVQSLDQHQPGQRGIGQFIVWCEQNVEQQAVDASLKRLGITFSSIYGSDPDESREDRLSEWLEGKTAAFVTKPVMYGSGVNLQQCNTAIFMGLTFKFASFIQAIKRVHRFLQTRPVEIHLIYTEAEREIRRTLERKWAQHLETVASMSDIIRQYGLAVNAMCAEFRRSFVVDREEEHGEMFTLVRNDCVTEAARTPDNFAGLILTSIPFSTQYAYTDSYNDFGHSADNEGFFRQMDFLTPELLRILKPGRVAAIHVKDRIVPGGLTGLGFQTVYPFHCDVVYHFIKHGFAFLGMKTIVTDVVRENNQTYRLGWSEQCKDGTRMGAGMPEYLLLFRKPPTDSSNGYADEPVLKDKPLCIDEKTGQVIPFDTNHGIQPGSGYSRFQWQTDAHGFMRSSGERLLQPADLATIPHEKIFKVFREHSKRTVYNYQHDLALGESLEAQMRLPVTFMLLQPQSWHPDVWTDITRMLTLNGAQYAAGREMHLCPMQFDLADRVIRQFSMAGETVFDPFAGIGSVPYRAVLMGRKGHGIELSRNYWLDSLVYCKDAEVKVNAPTLFDLLAEPDDIPLPLEGDASGDQATHVNGGAV